MANRPGPHQAQFVNHQHNTHNTNHVAFDHVSGLAGEGNVNVEANPNFTVNMGNINVEPLNNNPDGLIHFAPPKDAVVHFSEDGYEFFQSMLFQTGVTYCVNGVVMCVRRRILWMAETKLASDGFTWCQRVINDTLCYFKIGFLALPKPPPLDYKVAFVNGMKAGICFMAAYGIWKMRKHLRRLVEEEGKKLMMAGYSVVSPVEARGTPGAVSCPTQLAAEVRNNAFLTARNSDTIAMACKVGKKYIKDNAIPPQAQAQVMAGAVAAAMTPTRIELETCSYLSAGSLMVSHGQVHDYIQMKRQPPGTTHGFFSALALACKKGNF